MSHALIARLRGAGRQNRAEIAQLYVNVLRLLYRLRHLIAKQCAITLSQLMHQALHNSLGYTEVLRELRIRNILAFGGQTFAQNIEYATAPTGFALFSKT